MAIVRESVWTLARVGRWLDRIAAERTGFTPITADDVQAVVVPLGFAPTDHYAEYCETFDRAGYCDARR